MIRGLTRTSLSSRAMPAERAKPLSAARKRWYTVWGKFFTSVSSCSCPWKLKAYCTIPGFSKRSSFCWAEGSAKASTSVSSN
uniref:FI22302p1 n=1 Tax=Drosophila melanogaster TaxID=7227 RepID=T2GGD7_DROME|nr:FI22302p1 [Drosophila melanogaster]